MDLLYCGRLDFTSLNDHYVDVPRSFFTSEEWWSYMIVISPYTLLQIKVLYWHLWFHKEPLTSMEPFHWTKRSL